MEPIDMLADLIQDVEEDNLIQGKGELWMPDWGTHPEGHYPTEENYCGTKACLAGWMALNPKWRARGFKAEWVPTSWGWMLTPTVDCPEYYIEEQKWRIMTIAVFGERVGSSLSRVFSYSSNSTLLQSLKNRHKMLSRELVS